MKYLKCVTSSILVGLITVYTMIPAMAVETTSKGEVAQSSNTENNIEIINTNEVVSTDDLNVQLNDLYKEIGEQLNINYMYVKIMHMIAGGKAVYAEAIPNIKIDTTVDSLSGSFDIDGATQSYDLVADWIVCPDDTISRPSKYYLPDAAYNVMAEVIAIMNTRYYADRGTMQDYFNALNNDVKTTIIFCEAVLQYTGSTQESVNSFYNIYEKLLYDKANNEYVLESDGLGNYVFKDRFKDIITDNGINTSRELEILGIVLRFDSNLAASASTDEISDEYVMPYDIGYQSRENMMIAAMSVVGKVRYVWGGGHLGTGSMGGINPNWKLFYDSYGTTEDAEGYLKCIKPSSTWCPIHGEVSKANGCLFDSNSVHSAEEFINERIASYNVSPLENEQFTRMMNEAGIEHGIQSHRLDGLDCSGYASWVYNQVTDNTVTYDSGALRFISQRGIKEIPVGSPLLPGDVFSWGAHIIVIVGKVADNSKAYVMVESGPNVVKFGVAYYSGASTADITLAKNLALEANKLLGNLEETEQVRSFNMTTCKYSADEEGTNSEFNGYQGCGRLTKTFIDENTILSDYDKPITEMVAQEIIQHTINNLTYQYISGISTYDGELYSLDIVKGNMKMIDVGEVKKDDIILTTELSNQEESVSEQEWKVGEGDTSRAGAGDTDKAETGTSS